MKNFLSVIALFFFCIISAQVNNDASQKINDSIKIEQIRIAPCDVNKNAMKFEIDTLSNGVRISEIEAFALFKNSALNQGDLRMPIVYDLKNNGVTTGLRINLQQIKIGSLLLTNVDAIVVKDQIVPLIIGKNILLKTGNIVLSANNFKFSKLFEPYLPLKIDMTNDEFSANKRLLLIDQTNKSIRSNLISNLKRFVRSNESEKEKDLRVVLTFKVDVFSSSKNDEKYNEEIELNQKTVTGKMMFDTFKLLHNTNETKEIIEFYNTTSFNIVFIYNDKTIKFKYILSRAEFIKLKIPYAKEDFLQALSLTEKTKK